MDKLTSMKVFTKVAKQGSFSAAANELSISKAMVSKHVQALENDLDIRLFNRTTRSLSLTEVGAAYLERARAIMADIDEMEMAVSSLSSQPRGVLRVAAPTSFGAFHLGRAIGDFLERYQEVEVELILTDRIVDLIEEGLDVSVRVGELDDSSLIARKIASARMVVCASPDYLKQYGRPQEPEDLKNFNCLLYTMRIPNHEWNFKGPRGEIFVPVNGTFRSNVGDTLRVAANTGRGLIQLPTYMVGQDLKQGRLEAVLTEFEPEPRPIHAVYPHRQHLSAKVRVWVDYLYERFQPRPYWDEWLDT